MSRLLFCLRHRDAPWGAYGTNLSSGLRNSVRFVVEMLGLLGIEAKMVELSDNNKIDKEVHDYHPTHVIVESFWVVPDKFDVLKKLHPKVKWIVRDHSETPFLAMEGMCFGWAAGYLQRGIEISCNSPRAVIDMQALAVSYGFSPKLIGYTPNYYPVPFEPDANKIIAKHSDRHIVHIGCFGAIRPLKNHMIQAVAALRYAKFIGKRLEFYINGTRIEGGASPILRNLRELFENTPDAELIELPWMEHADFLQVLRTMDISLQVSFSETFNIVCADSVVCNVPIVCSKEVPWIGRYAHAEPTDSTSILNALQLLTSSTTMENRLLMQWRDLIHYAHRTKEVWWEQFGETR